MISSKEDALQCISQMSGAKQLNNKNELQQCIELLQNISANEGLPEEDLDLLVEYMTATKLASSIYLNLFTCFVPKTKISDNSLSKLLCWFFTEVSSEKIANSVERKFIQWLTGIVHYELGNVDIIHTFYYSFLFLLGRPHSESSVCKLLCLISKPEDAKRWIVQRVLHIQQVNGPKFHTNSLLSLLKSYRPDVVPERVPVTGVNYKNSGYDDNFEKAYSRKQETEQGVAPKEINSLQWNMWRMYDDKNKTLNRLIPPVESLNSGFTLKNNGKNSLSVMEIKTMASLGARPLEIEIPAQTLSLLANLAGYHVLAFSDLTVKARFSHKLYHTLCRVFLLELEPYSEKEKIYFLDSIKGLQEYTQQSIPVVTTFLFNYLLIWDGEDYREQILGLLEWIDIRNVEDLQKYVFPSLRQIFISSGIHCKYLIIETMGKLIRNLLIMDKREKNCFRNEYQECDIIKSIEAISNFVSGLTVNGLIWNAEKNTRNILMAALNFYDICEAVEQAGDLPILIIMPPTLAYKCLFSGSKVCIARFCSLLVRLQTNSVERLHLLGVFGDFANEVQQLHIYMMDYYRYLWSNINFRQDQDSFIFHDNIFRDILWRSKAKCGISMEEVLGKEYNSFFWDLQTNGMEENTMIHLAEDYPSVLQLKQVIEERLLQVE